MVEKIKKNCNVLRQDHRDVCNIVTGFFFVLAANIKYKVKPLI